MKLSKKMDREAVLQSALKTGEAIGQPLQAEVEGTLHSDHPYQGFSLEGIRHLVNGDVVDAQIKEFEKELKAEIDTLFENLEINTPVKVTKGSADKKGIEGFILHKSAPLQGNGHVLFVYDVLTHKSLMVRDHAIKARLPKPNERAVLKEMYRAGVELAPHYTQGKEVTHKTENLKGVLMSDAQLPLNLAGNGFYTVKVRWDDTSMTDEVLTNLSLKN